MLGAPYLGSNELALEQAVLTVDIVETAPETNLDEGVDSASPEPKPEPEPEIVKVAAPPPPPPAPPKEATQVVKIPDLKQPTPEAKPEKKPEIKQVVSLSAPPKRPFRQSPAYKKNKQKRDILRAQLQNLAEQKRRQKQKKPETKPKADDSDIKAKLEQLRGQALNTAQKRDLPSGISLADKLREHITKCWNPPPGAAGADALIVDIIVRLNPDAEVIDVAIKDGTRFARDGVFKAAANSARRAIFDCSPLPLPQEGNETWKELEIKFDPRFITRR